MAKRMAGTLLEKHGFADQDLFESKHDEICAWVDDNAQAIMRDTFGLGTGDSMLNWTDFMVGACKIGQLDGIGKLAQQEAWTTLGSDNMKEAMKKRISEGVAYNLCQPNPSLQDLKKNYGAFLARLFACQLNKLAVEVEWEVPLPGFSGFIDLVVTRTHLQSQQNGSTLDFYPTGGAGPGTQQRIQTKYFVEVKTRIESIGSILRELQFYKAKSGAASKRHVILVCPTHPHLERVKQQGFTVVVYDKERYKSVKRQRGVISVG